MTARKIDHAQWANDKTVERLAESDPTFEKNYSALCRNAGARAHFLRTNKGWESRFDVCKTWLIRSALARKRREEAESAAANNRLNRVEKTLTWTKAEELFR